MIGSGIFSAFGLAALALAMTVMGRLSKRLGAVTHTPRYYVGFYISAGLLGISILARLYNWLVSADIALLNADPGWVLLYIGLPALAVTLAVMVAWRYWSWLLAERG